MITGAHVLIYTERAEEVRAFFRDVLELPWVDSGGGWLIFALPPSEVGVHPSEGPARHDLTLMCDDIKATVAELTRRGAQFTRPVSDEGYGFETAIALPDGSELSLYQPKHSLPPRD
jgi:predicted enzyme related to lactoylglutathione lyase